MDVIKRSNNCSLASNSNKSKDHTLERNYSGVQKVLNQADGEGLGKLFIREYGARVHGNSQVDVKSKESAKLKYPGKFPTTSMDYKILSVYKVSPMVVRPKKVKKALLSLSQANE
eukprot:TRINITY_DN26009_c0_g1_i4.p1 TRINITY_DN26009_c0_g1~~TRINITY_DN26009_c0_g1_i4.p1  ORF type:complete len:115 (+),score=22.33 TRINITY_DN26009_c0_g1_i4:312-656(+)